MRRVIFYTLSCDASQTGDSRNWILVLFPEESYVTNNLNTMLVNIGILGGKYLPSN